MGLLAGFSNDFIAKAYSLTEEEAEKLVNSQKGVLIVKLSDELGQTLAKLYNSNAGKELVYNIDEACPDHKAENSYGFWTTVSRSEFDFIGKVGLSANRIELGRGSMSSPIYTADSSAQLIYVVKGGGRIQIVGMNGKRVLDSEVKVGHLVVVPRFFVVAILAEEQGLECLSVITSSE